MTNSRIADKLMELAARLSVQTQFGWAHPDCAILEEAARILRGDHQPEPKADRDIGVLSAPPQDNDGRDAG